ncbi:hypothetical protein F4819DRAFT_369326 [Hypoxylon fuscum]|nr:hypothetical protein F4819DRAFT_369326 [Hypoxylon fuscum]
MFLLCRGMLFCLIFPGFLSTLSNSFLSVPGVSWYKCPQGYEHQICLVGRLAVLSWRLSFFYYDTLIYLGCHRLVYQDEDITIQLRRVHMKLPLSTFNV